MFYGYDHGNAAKERHADLIRDAEVWRLTRKVKTAQASGQQWSSALRIWFGKQLIGWGRQLVRAA